MIMLIFVLQVLLKFLSETRQLGKPVIFHMEKCVCVCVCVFKKYSDTQPELD